MLSRTAENLYWTARYMERADTMARLLEMGYRMQLIPTADGGYASEWSSILAASGTADGYDEKYREVVEPLTLDRALHDSFRAALLTFEERPQPEHWPDNWRVVATVNDPDGESSGCLRWIGRCCGWRSSSCATRTPL